MAVNDWEGSGAESSGDAPADFRKSRRRRSNLVDPEKIDRLPPHSIEAEQGVLGCILLSPQECLDHCVEKLAQGSEVFYDLRHRTIYDMMITMMNDKLQVDLITLQVELKDANQLEEVGGLAYLAALPDAVPSAANLDYYIEIIREKYTLRKMISTCTEIVSRAYEHQGEVDELVDQVERDIHRITDEMNVAVEIKGAKQLIASAVTRIEFLHGNQGKPDGLPTGLIDLDKMIGGLRGAEMTMIAARPSVGKSSLMMNMAEHIAVENGWPVGVFSLEMSAESLMLRTLCSRARVDSRCVRDGFLAMQDFNRLTVASAQISKSPIYIDDSSSLSILQLKAKARRMHQRHQIKAIFIDYIQLLHSTNHKNDNRQQEVSDISQGCKAISKDLNIPVVVLSQLNRELERAGNRAPRLSDLRESGSLEQDSDIVLLLYKPDVKEGDSPVYNPDVAPVNCLVAKQRNGPTGEVGFIFIKSMTRFQSQAHVSQADGGGI